jgi:hypothetical protein
MTTPAKQPTKKFPLLIVIVLLLLAISPIAMTGHASAGSMTQTLVRLDRLALSANTGGLVCVKTTAQVATEGKILLTIPTNSATDYSLAVAASWLATGVAVSINGTTSTAMPGLSATAAGNVTGKVVTWTITDLAVNTLYCFTFGATPLQNANNNTETAPGSVETQTAAAASIDKGYYSNGLASPTVTGDQVSISNATVPPIFTFSLDSNVDTFPTNFSLIAITSTSGRTITVSTNAANGYIIWAKDLNSTASKGALKSTLTGAFIEGASAVGTASRIMTTGTRDYGMGIAFVTNNSGTATPHANYTTQGVGTKVGTLDTAAFQQIASATTGTSTDTYTVTERATISATTTAASDYADVITFVGSGLF